MSPVEYKKENDLHIIKITGKSRLTPIVRDGEELLVQLCKEHNQKQN